MSGQPSNPPPRPPATVTAPTVEQALRDSEARMKAIVETAVDGIITIDERGLIETVNPAAERLFGYAADELVGKNVHILMPEPYHSEHDGYLEHYQQTAERRIIGIGREVVGRRKDGSTFPMDLAVSEVQLGERRIFTGIVRDVTQRKQAEEGLRAAKEAAEAASKAKDHFLAVLSHELRTPLTPVLATVSYVEAKPGLPEELRSEISAIRRNVEMEARLIDDLLDLTRISRGKVELHHEVVDTHVVLRGCLENYQEIISDKRIEVAMHLWAKERHVWADPARLQQVFSNVLSNAVKFTPEAGKIALTTRNEKPGEWSLQIRDTGIGIDAEALPRIFNAFEQGERTITRQFGGLGLGLAISRAIVEMHHGTLVASSEGKERGAMFTLCLNTVAAPGAAQAHQSAPVEQPDDNSKKLRLLLVEDHQDTLRVLARLLTSLGHRVETASTVRSAMEMLDRAEFDLLVSDIGLPDGSGLDIMRYAKSRRRLRGIALSGFGQEEDRFRSREAGFERHVTKPVNLSALEKAIQQVAC